MGILRTIFAITVVLAHSPWNEGFVFVGGRNAVQLFYMISGFLISHIISTNPTYRSPLKFYLNRALRLYPIYCAVALLSLLAAFIANQKLFEIYRNIPVKADVLLILSNLFLFGQDWVMFSGIRNGHLVFTSDWRQSDFLLYKALLVPQAWTLGVELSFYALAPFVLRNKSAIILLIGLSLLVRLFLIKIGLGLKDPWVFRFFPSELSLFLLGALSNQFLLPLWKSFVSSNGREWIFRYGTYLIIFLSLIYFMIPIKEIYKTPFLFFVFLIFLPLTFLYQNASKLDKIIGELSYPIYIGHLLVITTLSTFVRHNILTNHIVISFLNVFGAIVFSLILNKYIGRPIEQQRAKIKSVSP